MASKRNSPKPDAIVVDTNILLDALKWQNRELYKVNRCAEADAIFKDKRYRTSAEILEHAEVGGIRVIFSGITEPEALYIIEEHRNSADEFRQDFVKIALYFRRTCFEHMPVDPQILNYATRIRLKRPLKTVDSIVVATAVSAGIEYVVSNDGYSPDGDLPTRKKVLAQNEKINIGLNELNPLIKMMSSVAFCDAFLGETQTELSLFED